MFLFPLILSVVFPEREIKLNLLEEKFMLRQGKFIPRRCKGNIFNRTRAALMIGRRYFWRGERVTTPWRSNLRRERERDETRLCRCNQSRVRKKLMPLTPRKNAIEYSWNKSENEHIEFWEAHFLSLTAKTFTPIEIIYTLARAVSSALSKCMKEAIVFRRNHLVLSSLLPLQ